MCRLLTCSAFGESRCEGGRYAAFCGAATAKSGMASGVVLSFLCVVARYAPSIRVCVTCSYIWFPGMPLPSTAHVPSFCFPFPWCASRLRLCDLPESASHLGLKKSPLRHEASRL